MDDLGPLSMLLSWQTLVLAMVISVSTSAMKTLIDIVVGGTEKRKHKPLFKEVIIPGLPGVFGIIFGALLPIQPDELIAYVQTHEVSMHVVGATYGLVVSVFSDWLYQRVRARLTALSTTEGA